MVTDSLIKKKFIHDTLQRGILKIYATQESVVSANFRSRTGRLITSLSKHSYDSQITGESETLYIRVLPYLRFLDMMYRERTDRIAKHRRAALALYNRVVWGVLYHETFPALRYGFTDEVRQHFHDVLQKSLNP